MIHPEALVVARAARPRACLRRRWTALLLATAGAAGIVAGPAAVAASGAAGPSRIELSTGARYDLRDWGSRDGSNGARQFYVPLDLAWRTPAVRLSAGADFSHSSSDLLGAATTAVYPSEMRASSEFRFRRDRWRVAGGVRLPFFDAGLTPEESRTASLLDEATLDFARTRHPGGRALVLEAGGQPIRRAGVAVQAGLAWEHRSSYEFLTYRRRIDPGDPWRLGLSVVAGRGVVLGELGLRLEKVGWSRLEAGFDYREGNALTVQAGLQRQLERGRIGISGALTARQAGTVETNAPLDRSVLRGGNSVRLTLSATRPSPAGEFGMLLGLIGVRGYAGDLGHAEALVPGLAWTSGLAGGRLSLGAQGVIGRCRGNRRLRGFGLSISWSGEWRR